MGKNGSRKYNNILWEEMSSSQKKNRLCRVLKMDCIGYWLLCGKKSQKVLFLKARDNNSDLDELRKIIYTTYMARLKVAPESFNKGTKTRLIRGWLGYDVSGKDIELGGNN